MSGLKIPFVNIQRQYNSIREELLHTQDLVYSSGRVLDGEYTSKFEDAISFRCGRKYAVAVNSCTQALTFASLITKGMGNVLVPAMTFIATANCVWMSGRNVNFYDVNSQGLFEKLPPVHPASTLIFVDLYGNIPDINEVKKFDGSIIEDAAQSFGATWNGRPAGSFGDISCLSFDPMKNLPNYGSGGMFLTNKKSYYKTVKDLRDNGKFNSGIGTNSKMSESDCACMLVKLKYFDQWQQRRNKIAKYYTETLKPYVEVPKISSEVIPSWHKYVIQTNNQIELKLQLEREGIETKIHYSKPLCNLKNTSKLSKRVLSLPIYPELTDSEVETITKKVIHFSI